MRIRLMLLAAVFAAAAAASEGPTPRRAVCEPAGRVIRLDGKEIASGVEPALFAYFRVLADNYPDPISFDTIKQKGGIELEGANQSRMKRRLKAQWRKLAALVNRSPRGHVLQFPD